MLHAFRRSGLLNEFLDEIQADVANGQTDQAADDRRVISHVASQGEHCLQSANRPVVVLIDNLAATADGKRVGQGAHLLDLRQKQAITLLAHLRENVPVAIFQSGRVIGLPRRS